MKLAPVSISDLGHLYLQVVRNNALNSFISTHGHGCRSGYCATDTRYGAGFFSESMKPTELVLSQSSCSTQTEVSFHLRPLLNQTRFVRQIRGLAHANALNQLSHSIPVCTYWCAQDSVAIVRRCPKGSRQKFSNSSLSAFEFHPALKA